MNKTFRLQPDSTLAWADMRRVDAKSPTKRNIEVRHVGEKLRYQSQWAVMALPVTLAEAHLNFVSLD